MVGTFLFNGNKIRACRLNRPFAPGAAGAVLMLVSSGPLFLERSDSMLRSDNPRRPRHPSAESVQAGFLPRTTFLGCTAVCRGRRHVGRLRHAISLKSNLQLRSQDENRPGTSMQLGGDFSSWDLPRHALEFGDVVLTPWSSGFGHTRHSLPNFS